jgi:hypothetical protein
MGVRLHGARRLAVARLGNRIGVNGVKPFLGRAAMMAKGLSHNFGRFGPIGVRIY